MEASGHLPISATRSPSIAHRLLVVPVCLLLALLAYACSDSGEPARPTPHVSTPYPSPTPHALLLTAAENEEGYPWDDRTASGARFFLYDAAHGTIRGLNSGGGEGAITAASWIDDQTLHVTMGNLPYSLSVDGRVSAAPPHPTATPYDTPIESPDTGWSAGAQIGASRDLEILIHSEEGLPVFRIERAGSPMWVHGGDFLVFEGGVACDGQRDIFRLEVQTGELSNLTGGIERWILYSIPHPDGATITYGVLGAARLLQNIDVATSQTSTLVTIPGDGVLRPIAWNRTGTLLLFEVIAFAKSVESCVDPPRVVQLAG